MRTYVIQTADGYLYPFEGAVSLTDEIEHAGHFLAADEAHVIAQIFGYTDGRYQVIAVEMPAQNATHSA